MNTPAEMFIARDRAARLVKCGEGRLQRAFDALGIEPAIEINFHGFYTLDQIEHAGVLVRFQSLHRSDGKGPIQ